MGGKTRAGLEKDEDDLLPLAPAKLHMVTTGSETAKTQWDCDSDGPQASNFGNALPVFKKNPNSFLLYANCPAGLL